MQNTVCTLHAERCHSILKLRCGVMQNIVCNGLPLIIIISKRFDKNVCRLCFKMLSHCPVPSFRALYHSSWKNQIGPVDNTGVCSSRESLIFISRSATNPPSSHYHQKPKLMEFVGHVSELSLYTSIFSSLPFPPFKTSFRWYPMSPLDNTGVSSSRESLIFTFHSATNQSTNIPLPQKPTVNRISP